MVLDEFAGCWDELDDPRTGNAALHDFHKLLVIALCSVLCDGQPRPVVLLLQPADVGRDDGRRRLPRQTPRTVLKCGSPVEDMIGRTSMCHDDAITQPARRKLGRPRSAASRRAVLDAAYAILVEEGLPRFSVEAVAARSGVARTTIYRSWPTKGLLAFESFRDVFEAQLTFDRTSSPEQDFHALVRSLARALGGPSGCLARSVIAEAQNDPTVLTQFLEHFSEPLRRRSTTMIQAGVDSGRFRHNLDVPRLLDAVVGAVYLRLLLSLPLDEIWANSLAFTLLQGSLSAPDIP